MRTSAAFLIELAESWSAARDGYAKRLGEGR